MITLAGFEYLIKYRHLTEETIRAFHLGYCDYKGFIYVDADFTDMFPPLTSVFHHAPIWPIFNLYGKVVGVSARPLSTSKDVPKYVNTVYPKAEHLYGLNVAWPHILKEKYVYVVEGNIDTNMMHQHGLKNVVGMLGSNFTTVQLCLLLRFAKRIVLVSDGDTAGRKVAGRLDKAIKQKFANANIRFSYLKLPTGYDPDKYLQEFGVENFKKLELVELGA